jgi:hypothetical protein
MTRTTLARLIILHLRQIGFTEARTFIEVSSVAYHCTMHGIKQPISS